nr:hypothetical protein Iba_chr06cCG9020 [Ipomoea batatas]
MEESATTLGGTTTATLVNMEPPHRPESPLPTSKSTLPGMSIESLASASSSQVPTGSDLPLAGSDFLSADAAPEQRLSSDMGDSASVVGSMAFVGFLHVESMFADHSNAVSTKQLVAFFEEVSPIETTIS